MMTTFENKDEWDACRPGEVSAVVRRLKTQRRTGRLQTGGVAAALMIGIGFLGYYFLAVSPMVDHYYAGISCTQTMRLASRYAAGQLGAERSQQIRDHLGKCDRCRERFEAMQTPDRPIPRTSIDQGGQHHALNARPMAFPVVASLSVRSVIDY